MSIDMLMLWNEIDAWAVLDLDNVIDEKAANSF